MARPIFSTNPSFGFLEQSVSTPLEKPLPPTPRRPSSAYTGPPNETELSYDGSIVDQYFANEILQPNTFRASASKIPDRTPLRPKLLRDSQLHAASDPVVERRRAEQNQHRDTEEIIHARTKSRPTNNANQHAQDYESVLYTWSSVLPSIAPKPFYSDHGHLPLRMSPRNTHVMDQSLVPPPLRFSNITYNSPASRFSSDSSSDAGSCHSGLRDSVRSYAKKTFSKRSFTPEVVDNSYLPSPSKPKSRLGSMASQRRASIQHGIEEMYDTLTSFSLTSAKHKPPAMQFENTRKIRISRERRSPAIPLTPYQILGVKAFEDTASSRSSKTSFLPSLSSRGSKRKSSTSIRSRGIPIRTPRNHSSSSEDTRPKPPLSRKLAAVLSNGTTQIESAIGLETNRVKRSKSEKRRAELKKKITVVGLGDGQLAGREGWM